MSTDPENTMTREDALEIASAIADGWSQECLDLVEQPLRRGSMLGELLLDCLKDIHPDAYAVLYPDDGTYLE